MRAKELKPIINFKMTALAMLGVSVFFLLTPSHEKIGISSLVASLLIYAMIRRDEATIVRFGYLISAICLIFFLPMFGYGGWKTYLIVYAGAFLAGYSIFYNKHDLRPTFILVFFLPWMLHILIGALQIANHLINYDALNIQHLLVSSKSSLSIGVKYYSVVISFVITSSFVFFHMNKNTSWKYIFALSLLMLGLIDNRAALISVSIATIAFHVAFGMRFGWTRAANWTFLAMIAFAVMLVLIVYSPRLLLGYESIVASLNFQEYQSWKDNSLFLNEFCEGDGAKCTVDQSIFYRLSWLFWGGMVVYDNPMGIGFGVGPLDTALQLYGMHNGKNLERDFHSEFMNIAVMFGAPGVLLFFGSFSLFFCALKKKIRVEDSRNRVGLAYAFLILLFLRLLIESVGSVGMYIFLLMLLAAIAAEANRAFKPI